MISWHKNQADLSVFTMNLLGYNATLIEGTRCQ